MLINVLSGGLGEGFDYATGAAVYDVDVCVWQLSRLNEHHHVVYQVHRGSASPADTSGWGS